MIQSHKVRAFSAGAFFLVAGCFVALPACESEGGSCERVIEACHDKDMGTGKPHECHEGAEAAGVTDATCALTEDECLAACE